MRGRGPRTGGSSPLTRGKHPDVRAGRRRSGLIPAHAGKTPSHPPPTPPPRAHPRSRGENDSAFALVVPIVGSSPLTRGKPALRNRRRCAARLIPAHAGKTRRNRGARQGGRAHPRSRGENLKKAPATFSPRGSSPLTRGKRVRAGLRRGRVRLIPAHAGKTSRFQRGGRSWKAHPRSRGENEVAAAREGGPGGSSPLTRGKRHRRAVDGGGERLIPAHAGKTLRSGRRLWPVWAHPRSRGENRRR